MDRKEEVNTICQSTRSIRSILAGVDFTAKDFIDTQLFDDDVTKNRIIEDLQIAQDDLRELIDFVSKMKVWGIDNGYDLWTTFVPDAHWAFVEKRLSHSMPVS